MADINTTSERARIMNGPSIWLSSGTLDDSEIYFEVIEEFGGQFGSLRVIWGRSGSFEVSWGQLELLGASWGRLGSFGVILGQLEVS